MRTLMFLDDWPILTRKGIDRRWFAAEPWPGTAPWHDPLLVWSCVTAVRRDPRTGGWRIWGGGMTTRDKSDEGIDWKELPVARRTYKTGKYMET